MKTCPRSRGVARHEVLSGRGTSYSSGPVDYYRRDPEYGSANLVALDAGSPVGPQFLSSIPRSGYVWAVDPSVGPSHCTSRRPSCRPSLCPSRCPSRCSFEFFDVRSIDSRIQPLVPLVIPPSVSLLYVSLPVWPPISLPVSLIPLYHERQAL